MQATKRGSIKFILCCRRKFSTKNKTWFLCVLRMRVILHLFFFSASSKRFFFTFFSLLPSPKKQRFELLIFVLGFVEFCYVFINTQPFNESWAKCAKTEELGLERIRMSLLGSTENKSVRFWFRVIKIGGRRVRVKGLIVQFITSIGFWVNHN